MTLATIVPQSTNVAPHYSTLIRERREKLLMTQDELASGICTRTYLNLIENARAKPSEKLLTKLAARLKINLFNLQDHRKKILDMVDNRKWTQLREVLRRAESTNVNYDPLYFWSKGALAGSEGRTDEMLQYLQKGLELCTDPTHNDIKIRILNDLTYYYYMQISPEQAELYNEQTVDLLRKLDEADEKVTLYLPKIYTVIADTYTRKSEYEKANEFYRKSNECYKKMIHTEEVYA